MRGQPGRKPRPRPLREPLAERRCARAGLARASFAWGRNRGRLTGTTVEERVAMVWQLAVAARVVHGREIPTYRRSEMPVRVLRKGERKDAK